MKVIRNLTIILVAIFIILTGIMPISASAADEKQVRLGIGTMGASFYYMALVLQPELEKLLPDYAIGISTGGDVANIKNLLSEDVEVAWLTGMSGYMAMAGDPPYVKNPDIRFVATYYDTYWQFAVRANSDINSLADLKGKKVGVGTLGQQQVYSFEYLLNYYGLDYEKIEESGGTIVYAGYGEGLEQLQDGTIDFYTYLNAYPWATVMSIDQAVGIKLIGLEDEAIEFLQKKYPNGKKAIIPKGTYSGMKEDTAVVSFPYIMVARKGVSDEVVYNICKATYDDISIWDDLTKGWETKVTFERALEGNRGDLVPLHPGAEKYYREKGLIK